MLKGQASDGQIARFFPVVQTVVDRGDPGVYTGHIVKSRLPGFDAKTPVFQGANEREIGLLLKLAGLGMAARTLSLSHPAPEIGETEVKQILADVMPSAEERDRVFLLSDANVNDLASRKM